jgi:hypothetical protein
MGMRTWQQLRARRRDANRIVVVVIRWSLCLDGDFFAHFLAAAMGVGMPVVVAVQADGTKMKVRCRLVADGSLETRTSAGAGGAYPLEH